MTEEFSYERGISKTKSADTSITGSVSAEVQASCVVASVTGGLSGSWGDELEMEETWSESTQINIEIDVPQGKQIVIRVAMGTYGTGDIPVYRIGGTKYHIYEQSCGEDP